MNSKKVITDYSSADFNGLAELWRLTDLGNPARMDNDEIILNTLKIGGKLLVMKLKPDLKIIGSSWMTTDGRRLFLHHFGIHPNYQGIGFAKVLMNHSMDFAKSLGLQIKLEVHINNHKARKLYENYGFKDLGDYRVYIIRDLSEIKYNVTT